MAELLYCSFCRKSQHQVRKLVAGPDVHICDDCIRLASDIIETHDAPPPGAAPMQRLTHRLRTAVSRLRGLLPRVAW